MKAMVSFDAGDEVIMNIAGHVSRAMLSRYSHVRMEAKRHALDEIAARQIAADEKRKAEAETAAAARERLSISGDSVIASGRHGMPVAIRSSRAGHRNPPTVATRNNGVP